MRNFKLKLSLYINFFVCTILLNSVGIVILQVIDKYQVGKVSASILEACKDLTIAVTSFLLAPYVPYLGYKKTILVALVILMLSCIAMPLIHNFLITKLFFIGVGISFALIKVSAYSLIGLISESPQQHASFLGGLEGVFQIGVLSGYWVFGYFIAREHGNWLDTYWFLAALTAVAFGLLLTTKIDESMAEHNINKDLVGDFVRMIHLLKLPLVLTFVLAIFIYVFIEQGIQTWLPTFNNKVIQLPETLSIQMTSIFALSIAFGRVFASLVIEKIYWLYLVTVGIFCAAALVVLTLPLTSSITITSIAGWSKIPLVAYLFPLIGFFLGPIYPILCSSVLSKLSKESQSSMTGLIVAFSALGGTFGSRIVSVLFSNFGGQKAFYSTLVPMLLLFLLIFPYHNIHLKFKGQKYAKFDTTIG